MRNKVTHKVKRFAKRNLVFVFLPMSFFILLWMAITAPLLDKQQKVVFSHETGFYDEPFMLSLETVPDNTIYYTTDSSIPNISSFKYTEPIRIGDASNSSNVYSCNDDISVYLRDDLIDLGLVNKNNYCVPKKNVDKGTVIRAISVDKQGNISEIFTEVYFVGFQRKTEYENVNTISVVANPEDLFGYENGILVNGKYFNEYFLENGLLSDMTVFTWPTNSRQRGKEWRRTADISFFIDQKNSLSGKFEISVRGGASRGLPNKGLNIYTDTSLITLSPGNVVQDYVASTLAKDMNLTVLDKELFILFINGEYWGNYWLSEGVDENYFENRYNVYRKDIVYIKTKGIEIGKNDDYDSYQEMVQEICRLDMKIDENYDYFCSLVDIDSCLDYYATEIYLTNYDWPWNNYGIWRSKNKTDVQGYNDGKWRWVLYDVDQTMDYQYADKDWVQRTINGDELFASIMENENFSQRLQEKLIFLANEVFAPELVENLINEYEEDMADTYMLHENRFSEGNVSRKDFYKKCEDIKSFFKIRQNYIIDKYGEK